MQDLTGLRVIACLSAYLLIGKFLGHFNIHIPGDIDVTDVIGIAEYGYFDGLDDPLFRFLYSLLDSFPWIP